MRQFFSSLLVAISFSAISTSQALAAPDVVTTIRPLHSIVSSVMEGVGQPHLLLTGQTSPHNASLKPSQAKAMQNADVIFWVGPTMESFLIDTLPSLSKTKTIVELSEAPNVTTYPRRGKADAHDEHHDEEEKDHDAKHDDEHHEEEGHKHHGTEDGHIWLDPQNAKAMALEIAKVLVSRDPENEQTYRENAAAFSKQMDDLEQDMGKSLSHLKEKPYFVQHDAYQYLEKRFGLKRPIALQNDVQLNPGAASVRHLREVIAKTERPCLLMEPQANQSTANALFEGTDVQRGVIDPLGQTIAEGGAQYATMMRGIASTLAKCLAK